MSRYQTHHVLIFDATDDVVLAGAGLKLARHPNARLFFSDSSTISPFKKKAFDATRDKAPWKLHVIEHGSEESMKILRTVGDSTIAQWIVDSGIADQPMGGTSVRPKVRLDVCESGLDTNHDPTNSVVMKLAGAIKFKLPAGRKLIIEGCRGTCIGPWTAETSDPWGRLGKSSFRSGKRQVIGPGEIVVKGVKRISGSVDYSDADRWTVSAIPPPPPMPPGTEFMEKWKLIGYLWLYFKAKNAPKFTTSPDKSTRAKRAWLAYKKTCQEWYDHLDGIHANDLKLFLPKDEKKDYLLREVASN